MRLGSFVVATGCVFLYAPRPALAQTMPAPPQVFIDTTYVPPSGRTINVPAGGDFQAALNDAKAGDAITLEAGATFTGNFTLHNKTGSDWITIRTSAPDSILPPAGTRITPALSNVMPKLVTASTNEPVLRADAGAHHYRFIGIELGVADGVAAYNLIELGNGLETSVDQLPHHIVIDRCYLHGTQTKDAVRGVALNSAWSAIIDSYLSDFHATSVDSQAIGAWGGPGPFKIVNNFLSGAGENVLFGGADPRIAGLVPSDIEFRRNHVFKPFSWKVGDPAYAGIRWTVKNSFELKNAQRVLVENNTFEGNWTQAQTGFAIVFTPRNQDGRAPWSVVQDVTFAANVIIRSDHGINISGRDNNFPSRPTARILMRDNLLYLVGGRMLQVLDGTSDVTFEHNTADHTGETTVNADAAAHTRFTFRNNIVSYGTYGIFGSGAASGNATLKAYFPGAIVERNVFAGANATAAAPRYPPDNVFVVSMDDVGFTDRANRNYRLRSSSRYTDAASDGTAIGANMDAITSDMIAPTVTMTSPSAGVVSGTITVSAAASDNVGVTGVQFKLDGVPIGAEVGTAPFAIRWNASSARPGNHALTAVARDAAGNAATSAGVTIIVVNVR
jgi:hypothetical protein